jgi:4Fe-4S ferredoxin
MVDKEVTPESIMPYDDILVNEEDCDYCKLCEKICPEEAIKVEGNLIDFILPEKIAEISINQELCSYCGYCEAVCPYDAIKSVKPTEGSLRFFEKRKQKCEPLSCMACVNICKHNRVWWVSDGLHFNEDFCIHCGACENSCPYDLIEVRRECYYAKELIDPPWKEAWNQAIERVVSKIKQNHRMHPLTEIPEVIKEPEKSETVKKSIRKRRVEIKEVSSLKRLEEILKIAGYRRAFEKGNAELLLKIVRKHASKGNKGNKKQEA